MNPLNPTPQEQEEKRGEGARVEVVADYLAEYGIDRRGGLSREESE